MSQVETAQGLDGPRSSSIHCRICGSFKFNESNYDHDLYNKVELHHLLRRDGALDELIRPCECRGEFAYAHRHCLSHWIETTKHPYCDICRFTYHIRLVPRSFYDWIFETQQVESLLKVLSVVFIVYYSSALGLSVSAAKPTTNLIDVVIVASSCTWIAACSLFLLLYSYQEMRKFLHWRETNLAVLVEQNHTPQLDTEPNDKDVLKSSGYKPSHR